MSRREMAADVLDDEQRRDLAAWERATGNGGSQRNDGFLRVDEGGITRNGDWIPGREAE